MAPPPGIDLEVIPTDRYLSEMFEAGELDAYMTARAPSTYLKGLPIIARLFPDVRIAEAAYWEKTKLFPIMHMIGVKKALAAEHPWLPMALYNAFAEAKRIAMEELEQIGVLKRTLPWVTAELDATRALMGDDFWPYGIAANRHALETITRYSHEQGLATRKLAPEEMFHPSTLGT